MDRGARLAAAIAVCTFLACTLAAPAVSQAQSVERMFRGKIVLLAKRPPANFPSQAAWARFLRANGKTHLWPDKNDKKRWQFEFMAFFKKPLNDIEVTVKFYDVTENQKRFVAADNWDMPSRGQRVLASSMDLRQPRFGVDRKYIMQVLSARNELLASTTFWLRGQKEVYSGRVTFSDEEARRKD